MTQAENIASTAVALLDFRGKISLGLEYWHEQKGEAALYEMFQVNNVCTLNEQVFVGTV